MADSTRIAIIGTGNVGGGLATTLAKAGYALQLGVRPGSDVKALLGACGAKASATSPEDAAAWAEVVFLAVPAAAAVDVARALGAKLEGKVVVDCNNPLTWKDGPVWAPPAEGSLAAAIAKAAPGAHVVKAFNQFGAEHHADPRKTGAPAHVLMAADDAGAKAKVATIARTAGFEPIDAGPLRNAGLLENLAMLWIHLAMVGGQGREFVFALRGDRKA